MKLESLRLKNFKTFQNVQMVDIPNLCVVVGANGTGKTTLFDAFGFLKDCLNGNATRALQNYRGGYHEVVSRGHDGEDIEIEIKFRMKIADTERLVTYFLAIGMENKKPIVVREILKYKRGQHGSPFHFLDFSRGKGFAISNEEDFSKPDEELTREIQEVGMDVLAIKGLGQFGRFKAANAFRELIENWYVSDFHINLARNSKDTSMYSEHLSVTGDNLQAVANNLFQTNPAIFRTIIEKMKRRIPGVGDISVESLVDGRLILKFQDGSFKDPFIDKYVSDGTIKMFAYLVLLHDDNPHPLMCIEEPENQLYPKLLLELAEEFREYAFRGGQVFVSTHSPDLLNAIKLDEVFWLVKKDGFTQIKRARDDAQISAYMNDGDKMGYLWKEGFFEGADPR